MVTPCFIFPFTHLSPLPLKNSGRSHQLIRCRTPHQIHRPLPVRRTPPATSSSSCSNRLSKSNILLSLSHHAPKSSITQPSPLCMCVTLSFLGRRPGLLLHSRAKHRPSISSLCMRTAGLTKLMTMVGDINIR